MKKFTSSILILMVGLWAFSFSASAQTLRHGSVYSENFNGATTEVIASGWAGNVLGIPSIIDGDVVPTPPATSTWGGVAQAYHTQSVSGDRAFGFYKSNDPNGAWIQLNYTPTQALTNISVTFDLECTWVRNNPSGAKNLGFQNLKYSTNGGTTWTSLGAVGPVAFASTLPATTWLSDAQMDAAGMSGRQ